MIIYVLNAQFGNEPTVTLNAYKNYNDALNEMEKQKKGFYGKWKYNINVTELI